MPDIVDQVKAESAVGSALKIALDSKTVHQPLPGHPLPGHPQVKGAAVGHRKSSVQSLGPIERKVVLDHCDSTSRLSKGLRSEAWDGICCMKGDG